MGFGNIAVLVAVVAVALVVLAGFFNLARGGDDAPARSQTLMRWRVGLQFLAVVVIVIVLLIQGR